MNTYLNPQMLSLEELHEAHLEKAKKYLETKWDASYYKFEPPQYEYDDYEDMKAMQEFACPYYRKLTDEQLSKVQKLMKESGETLWYDALSDDYELQKLLVNGCGDYPTDISDTPYQYCDCLLGIMDSKGQMSSYSFSLLLSKEDYLKLLVIVMDHRWITFNDLYMFDMDLFKSISDNLYDEVRNNAEIHKPSYTIVLDEIEKDVQFLLGEEDVFDVWHDDEIDGDKVVSLSIHFSENRMGVWQIVQGIDGCTEEVLYNIDAQKIMEALNTDTYHDASILLKDRCYNPHPYDIRSFYKIKEFLDNNKIGYENSKETTYYDE